MRMLVAALALSLISAVSAMCEEARQIILGAEVNPLKGAVAFCKESPKRCEPQPAAVVEFDSVRMAELVSVNDLVNNRVEFHAESPGADVWKDENVTEGDCEDLAFVKRLELIERGWPPGSLRAVIVMRNKGDPELHLLLTASTSEGEFVLDVPGEATGKVRPWNAREFHQLVMVWNHDARWYALSTEQAMTVGSK